MAASRLRLGLACADNLVFTHPKGCGYDQRQVLLGALRPESAEVQYNVGRTLLQTGNIAEAIAQYQQVLKQQPDFEPAKQALAEAQKPTNSRSSQGQGMKQYDELSRGKNITLIASSLGLGYFANSLVFAPRPAPASPCLNPVARRFSTCWYCAIASAMFPARTVSARHCTAPQPTPANSA